MGYQRLFSKLIPLINYFPGWVETTPTIPEIYWNVYSQEQRWKWLCCTVQELINYVNKNADALNIVSDELEKLYNEFEKFKESGFNDYYADQVAKWIDDNLKFVFEHTAKQVFFGLTDNGYFCAYVPESWNEIEFDTGMVYGNFDYGRLILRYNADGSGVIDNTGRYDDSNTDSIISKMNNLEKRVTTNENTLYTNLNSQ